MNKWERLGVATVPGGGGVMDLYKRGDELAIRVDSRELMSSRVHGSEDALAEMAWQRVTGPAPRRMLVGGLGMGFTLAAALKGAGPDDEVVVAELVPEVIEWNRGVIGPVAGHPLNDPRAKVHQGDVGEAIRADHGVWDAILLDVDNGPVGLTRPANDALYNWNGLDAARLALKKDGVLAVWSAAPDAAFGRRFTKIGFDVDEVTVRARGAKGGRKHTIWFGTRIEIY